MSLVLSVILCIFYYCVIFYYYEQCIIVDYFPIRAAGRFKMNVFVLKPDYFYSNNFINSLGFIRRIYIKFIFLGVDFYGQLHFCIVLLFILIIVISLRE